MLYKDVLLNGYSIKQNMLVRKFHALQAYYFIELDGTINFLEVMKYYKAQINDFHDSLQ